ncbi:MAG: hypothetical protein J0I11_09790 [Actinobacteria bacterium]|nr:hypothetical protein [Actinomycetota bacterium]
MASDTSPAVEGTDSGEARAPVEGLAAGAGNAADTDREDVGGDPACWLNRVCADCGRFVDDEFAEVCPYCGTPRDLGA